MLARWSACAALPLRAVLGGLLLVLGATKLMEPGFSRAAQLMESIGLAPGAAWTWGAGLLELLGGAALVLGLLTRWTSLVLAVESVAALAAAGAGAAVNVEARVAMLGGLAALVLMGPQRYALDLRLPALSSWSEAQSSGPVGKAA